MFEQQLMDCDSDSSGKDGSCQSSGCDAVLILGSICGKYSVDDDEGSHCAAVIQRLWASNPVMRKGRPDAIHHRADVAV